MGSRSLILLDTHVWIWYLDNPASLPAEVLELLETHRRRHVLYLSSISVWEIAMLEKRGRLDLAMAVADWLAKAESLPFLRFVPANNNILLKSVQLESDPLTDPADRIIVSTALSLGARLITKDKKIHQANLVKTFWP